MYRRPVMVIQENRCAFPCEVVSACGIRLLTVWRVKAAGDYRRMAERSRYDSRDKIHQAGKNLVAVRTDGGEGVLVAKGRRHVLRKGSLLLFDFPSLEEYQSAGSRWDFWWVEFSVDDALRLPLHEPLDIPAVPQERSRCEQVFENLQLERIENRCLAAAIWQGLYHEWWAQSNTSQHSVGREETLVQRVFEAVRRNPSLTWSLEEMAAVSGMGPSTFRAACQKVLGKSPARAKTQLKLSYGYEYLRRGDRSVAEVAAALGFCDPFHFSKAFKKEYGCNPSAVTAGLARNSHAHQRPADTA